MRGKEDVKTGFMAPTGITPAYAGKSPVRRVWRSTSGDHPRVCGEKPPGLVFRLSPRGSPPRMRGKGGYDGSADVGTGITPAYAGKSFSSAVQNGGSGDHPRVCGEKFSHSFQGLRCQGSPPRMRGKVRIHITQSFHRGITPAYAGKRCPWGSPRWLVWDHPRVCGEKLDTSMVTARWSGSPPRMRGKADAQWQGVAQKGITPAYAGKSNQNGRKNEVGRDHPRVCGEKVSQCGGRWRIQGSPPRMRGKAPIVVLLNRFVGITPAYAGKSIGMQVRELRYWDHPRVCGEKMIVLVTVL